MSSLDNVVSSPNDTNTISDLEVVIGRVKWFNNKTGFGFITVTDGEKAGMDIFVHHSGIGVSSQQYRYLVQGEYVEFKLKKVDNGKHDFQAMNVCGIKNGKLMCETRRELKISRSNYLSNNHSENIKEKIASDVPRIRGSGPRETNEEWSVVKKEKITKKKESDEVVKKPRGRPPRSV